GTSANQNLWTKNLEKVYLIWLQHENGFLETVNRILEYELDWEVFEKTSEMSFEHTIAKRLKHNLTISQKLQLITTKEIPLTSRFVLQLFLCLYAFFFFRILVRLKGKVISTISQKWPSQFCESKVEPLHPQEKSESMIALRTLIDRKELDLAGALADSLFDGFYPFHTNAMSEAVHFLTTLEGVKILELLFSFLVYEKTNKQTNKQ
ncbi:hypothetical protein RFI_09644, partial [Reticulomyxa filosa]